MPNVRLRRVDGARYEIDRHDGMRVPGVIFASEGLLPDEGGTAQQVANVATLPGIVDASYAMPDLHLGYGFPIGGVAGTDVAAGGVVSPGGVGFDISCGVRLHAVPAVRDDVGRHTLERLMDALADAVPTGTGPGAVWRASRQQLDDLLADGAVAAVDAGYGTAADLDRIEDGGRLQGAAPSAVGDRALQRGLGQVGSLGGGNHFLEVEVVERVLEPEVAEAFGLREGQLTVAIHCGSRGLGHQICTDHVKTMQSAMRRHGVEVPDRQLAAVPVDSDEGRAYLGAMAAAANYARANRQVLGAAAARAVASVLGTDDLPLVYDVSHNTAKLERHRVDGREAQLCVHRKGATRALPAGHPDLPQSLRPSGQPVLVPGSMGTGSWVLVGEAGRAFASTCHGAGRLMSRAGAKKQVKAPRLRKELEALGVVVRARSSAGLAEEAPAAYKDVDEVVRVCEEAGLSRRVARLRPLGVVKG